MERQRGHQHKQRRKWRKKPANTPKIRESMSLHCAAAEGNLELVKELIEEKSQDPEHKTPDGITPLHCASCCGRLEVVEYLINKMNCDPTTEDKYGECPIAYSAAGTIKRVVMKSPLNCYARMIHPRVEHIKVALFLLKSRTKKIEVIRNPKLLRVLRLPLVCSSLDDLPLMVSFIKLGKDCGTFLLGKELCTCINMATDKSQWDYVKSLLSAYPEYLKVAMGSDSKYAQTIFHDACSSYDADVQLIKAFCGLSLEIFQPDVELVKKVVDRSNKNCGSLVQYLLEVADHPLTVDKNGDSWSSLLLYVLTRSNCRYSCFDEKLVEVVSTTFSGVDLRDQDGNNPLHLACMWYDGTHYKAAVSLLARNSSYQNAFNNRGQLPLHIACNSEHVNLDTIRLISSHHELDVNKQDKEGNTPLHLICYEVDKYYRNVFQSLLECFKCMIEERKCDINVRNNKGELPLHIILKQEPLWYREDYNREALIKLCSSCIHVNTQDNDGNTPLHIACRKKGVKTVLFLTSSFSCDTNLLNDKQCLPLHYAVSSQMPLEAVEAVSARCTQIHTQNSDGLTPLHIACNNMQMDIVRFIVLNEGFSKQLSKLSDVYDNLNICVLCQNESDIEVLKLLATTKNANLYHQRDYYCGSTPIHTACARNNLSAAKYLIEILNCNLSCEDSKGRLPFHVACSHSMDCMQLIASFRHNTDDVNTCDNKGNTPLHLALEHNRLDIAKFLLLNFTCNVNLCNHNDELPLYLVSGTTLELVKMVTSPYVSNANVNRQSKVSGGTPLHVACQSGKIDIVQYLVKRFQCEPSMKQRDRDGKLPVDYACRHSLEMVKLVSQPCTIKELGPRNDVTRSFSGGRKSTTLDVACSHNAPDVVDYLVNHKGCDLSAFGNDQCALLYACGMLRARLQICYSKSHYESWKSNAHSDIIEFLITKCGYDPCMSLPRNEFEIRYLSINSTFHYACEQNDLKLMKALTILSVNLIDVQGNTPLHYACMYGCTGIVKYLVNCDCDQTIFNQRGELALHLACDYKSQNSLDIIQMLTRCDISSVNANGDNLLHIACANSKLDVIKYLIEEIKFDLNITNKQGRCAIHKACEIKSPEAAKLLQLYYRCDINCQDDKGDTPLHIACSHKSHEIINCILSTQSCRADISNKNDDLALHQIVRPYDNWSLFQSDNFKYKLTLVKELSLKLQQAIEMVIKRYDAALVSANNEGFTPIHFAIFSGDLNMFEALNNMDFVFSSTIGSSFLHIACEYRQPKLVGWLVEHGAKLTLCDSDGNLPQHLCFLGKQPICLETLSRLGAFDLYSQNNTGDSIVHMACRYLKHELLHKILESNDDYSEAMLIQNCDKDTPLHVAANKSVKLVKLVATSENIDMQNNNGDTPLHIACQFLNQKLTTGGPGYYDPETQSIYWITARDVWPTIYYLISHMKCSVELVNKDGDSPFHILLGQVLTKCSIDPLLQYIPKPLCDRKNKNGETLLHIACRKANAATVLYLIEMLKCKTDLIVECSGATALHFASSRDFLNPIRLLSDCCPVTQIQNTSSLPKECDFVCGDTALHIACRKGRDHVASCLLKGAHKEALNMANSQNELPFHLACYHGEKMVKVFIAHARSFDCNAVTVLGDTPLHIPCKRLNWRDESAIKLLLDKFQCNIGVANKQKNLPLHIACQHNSVSYDIIDKLTAPLSADQLGSQNLNGDTALHTLLKSSSDRYCKLDTSTVQILIERMPFSATCLTKNNDDKLSIHLASCYEKLPIIKRLHELYTLHSLQLPPFLLHEACHNNDPAVLNYMVKNCSDDINATNTEGNLPIHLALRHNRAIASTYSIVKRTTNVNQTNNQGNTPLHELYSHSQRSFEYSNRTGDIIDFSIDFKFPAPDYLSKDGTFNSDYHELLSLFSQPAYRHNRDYCDQYVSYISGVKYDELKYSNYMLRILLNSQDVDLLKQNLEGQTPLHYMCAVGDYDDLQTVVTEKSINANIQDNEGCTLLHIACMANSIEAVRILLSIGGIDLSIKNKKGHSPITLAYDSAIVKLLIEHGADPQPLYDMHQRFFQSMSSEKPPPTPVKLLVIGNPSVGKTTLIHSLQKECVESSCPEFEHTAGVVPTKFSSIIYGEVTFYDFAGQPEFYASNDAVIHDIIKNSPPIVIVLVNLTDSMRRIEDQTHYWIHFMENRFHTTLKDKAHMVVVCSHADVLQSKGIGPATKVCELRRTIAKQVDGKTIALKGVIHIDCRRSISREMDSLQEMLKNSTNDLREERVLHFNSHNFYVFLLKEFKGTAYITLACIFSKVKFYSKESSQNPLHLLPTDDHKIIRMCHDLSERGHIHFIENPLAIDKSWILLDKQPLLEKLLGPLFAPSNFPQHCPLSYSTGVVPLTLFKERISEKLNCPASMLLTFLSRMEYCREITDEAVIDSIVKQEVYSKTEKYYFFPNLVSLQRPHDKWRSDNILYKCGWLIQCTRKGEFFSPHFVQALLLRLVFSFTTKKALYDSNDVETYDESEKAQNHIMAMVIKRKCSVWKNGIYWQDENGVVSIIDIIDQRTLLLLMNCQCGNEMSLVERRSHIMSMVLTARDEFCSKAELLEYFIHPDFVTHPLLSIEKRTLFSLPCVEKCITEEQQYALNEHDMRVKLEKLLYFEPYAELHGHVVQTLCNQDTINMQIQDKVLKLVAEQLHHRYPLLKYLSQPPRAVTVQTPHRSNISENEWMLLRILRSRLNRGTLLDLRRLLDQISIFRGRQPPLGTYVKLCCLAMC